MQAFNSDEAKQHLQKRAKREKSQKEEERKELLAKAIVVLKKEFQGSSTEVFLVGSITRPYGFTPRSDIDVVLKHFSGDRFDLWTKLESHIGRAVELIPFETCHFQKFVLKEGLKVL